MSKGETVRFTINIPRDLNDRLVHYIPWGMKNNIILSLLEQLAVAMEQGGRAAYVDILDGKFQLTCNGLVEREQEKK